MLPHQTKLTAKFRRIGGGSNRLSHSSALPRTTQAFLGRRAIVLALGVHLVLSGVWIASAGAQTASPARGSGPQTASTVPAGTPYSPAQLQTLLPSTVYFGGRTAPLQLRNAAGMSLAGGGIVWAALVDTSGYASSVQERYQFYLVTESPLEIGGAHLTAGAYGGGFVGERFAIMDLGGHDVAEGSTMRDSALPRPRPLQLIPEAPDAVKLYLGRRWVSIHALPGADASKRQ